MRYGHGEESALTAVREVAAKTVPQGDDVTIAEGDEVQLFQRKGSSITVLTAKGTLLRVDSGDADALGLDADPDAVAFDADAPFDMENVTAALHTVFDPEIPVSVVDLGLIYRCDEVTTDDGRRKIDIDMTMTAPGCGMGDVICADAKRAVERVPGVDEVEVNLVFMPPWSIARMSEETRLELGLM